MLLPAVALAASPPPTFPAAKGSEPEKFVWSELLPTAWQQNPKLFFTVFTEFSEAGKEIPEVTPEHPAFFQLRSSGYRELGDTPAGEKTLKAGELEPILLKALATGGYHPAKPEQTPSLLVVYRWGTHYRIDPDNPDRNLKVRNMLERAMLVGGERFAHEFEKAYRESLVLGEEWFNSFKMRDSTTEFLVERSELDDIYYIVASAYDYASMREGRPVHLWRTRVTVTTQGVTQEKTLPTMIIAAGPFFGKETDSAAIIGRRTVPRGSVEIGTPTVVKPADTPAQAPAGTVK